MENKQQPEALRLAEYLMQDESLTNSCNDAAQELRRLHTESEHHLQELAAYRFTVDNLRARVAELEQDAARLLYATKDYDGFVHVKRDKYDFALECMEESGRSDPTIEDELNGVRRLIDAAIAAQAKQGGA